MCISCTLTVNDVEYWRDLEIWVRGTSKVIENSTIRKPGYPGRFPLPYAFYSNFSCF